MAPPPPQMMPSNGNGRGHLNLATSIRSLRLRSGLSQRQLAARMSVDPWAGNELAAKGEIPEVFTALGVWNSALFILFTILAFGADMRHGHPLANPRVALMLSLLDFIHGIRPGDDVRVGVENSGEKLQGPVLACLRQFKEPPFLQSCQYAAHNQSVPKRRPNHILTPWVSTA